jgi:hypothetical protein
MPDLLAQKRFSGQLCKGFLHPIVDDAERFVIVCHDRDRLLVVRILVAAEWEPSSTKAPLRLSTLSSRKLRTDSHDLRAHGPLRRSSGLPSCGNASVANF